MLACQDIVDDEETFKRLDDAQQRQLKTAMERAARDLKEVVWRTYRYVLLLGRDNTLKVTTDGRKAADLIGHMPIPDLITLDIDLPYATGDELMLKIKTTEGWERVPVVMVTRKPKTVETTWAVKTGARAYLVKPFKPEQLIECVGKLVAKQAG